jgi:lipopolysaccharide transport protein LptA
MTFALLAVLLAAAPGAGPVAVVANAGSVTEAAAGEPAVASAAPAAEAAAPGEPAAAAPAEGGAPVPAPAPPGHPGEIDIRSETLVIQHAERQATFGGGVTAVRGDLTLSCPEVLALYDAKAKVTVVRCVGPVTAVQGARTMNAGAGEFDNVTGILSLTGEPTLVEGERRLAGDHLTYDVAGRKAELSGARARLPAADSPATAKLAGQGPLFVAADRVVYDTEGRVATFRGGVTVTRGDLVLRAPRLVARLDDEGRIRSAVSGGGPVTVVQGERRGRARKATFAGAKNTLVLEGEPTVTDRESTLAGDTITFLLAEDRVEVERPRASFPLRGIKGETE